MRQLNQQIQMLVEESAARKKLRRQPGGDRGPGPGPATKKKLVSPALASPGAGGVAGALHDTPKGRGRGGGPSPGGGPPPSKRPKVRQDTCNLRLLYVLIITKKGRLLGIPYLKNRSALQSYPTVQCQHRRDMMLM